MIRMAHDDPSTRVRGQAIFWLAQAGGKKVAQQITDAIDNDPETEVKKRAVFALTQMPEHEGVPMLIQVAKTNRNPVVRKQAIFWLRTVSRSSGAGLFGRGVVEVVVSCHVASCQLGVEGQNIRG